MVLITSLIILGVIALIFVVLASLYTIVPADYAHVVVQKGRTRIFSPTTGGKAAYYRIPSWFFLFGLGMQIHRIPLKQLSLNVPKFLTFDKDRARFTCDIVAYVTVNDPLVAARRFSGNVDYLKEEVSKQVQAITRDATTKSAIREIINDRESLIAQINAPLQKVLATWGLELQDIELIDFQDPVGEDASHVIADISSIIEEQINSEARQKNAEQKKTARMKEAESEEIAKQREITRDELVAMREQDKIKKVAEQQKIAKEAELEVTKVQQVKTAEIQKAKMIVEANQAKEVEGINKEQKLLAGQGDRLAAEERAKGDAAPIREKGYAEAEAKEKLQAALNKFQDAAIRALVAEKIVAMQQAVGIETAKALSQADVRVFAGGEGDTKNSFDIGKITAAMMTSNQGMADSVLNRLARPSDLGIGSIAIGTDKPIETVKSKK